MASKLPSRDDDFIIVAAIDFGTTFSGYAFSFKATKDDMDLPEKIRTNKSWGAALGFQSYKTATSVLTTKSGKFLAFGFEAEQQYGEALEEDDEAEPDMLLFRHFKMVLHQKEHIKATTTISSVEGTLHPALNIFAHAIRYLKDHLLDAIKLETGSYPSQELLRWVITVPAIWSESSKQFMREAAKMAGCVASRNSKQLILALEPEAASLCCRRLNMAQYTNPAGVSFPAGTKYMVLDCGGGTIDITVHELRTDNTVREILHASGGPWGGTQVDRNFTEFLESILGKNFLNKYKQQCPYEWLQLLTNFEKIKKSLKAKGQSRLNIQIPYSMGMLFAKEYDGKEIGKAMKEQAAKGVGFTNGMIAIKNETAKMLFEPVIQSIEDHVGEIIRNPKARGLKYILMVGGFSECQLLQCKIKEAFEGNISKVLIPSEAQLAVIKGAVLYGHAPSEVSIRISRKSYGVSVTHRFNPSIHDESRKEIVEGRKNAICRQIFSCYIAKGEEVTIGGTKSIVQFPTRPEQRSMSVRFFAIDGAPNKPVQYIDDKNVQYMGMLRFDLPGEGLERKVEMHITFGGTEMQVQAKELLTGSVTSATLDFLLTNKL